MERGGTRGPVGVSTPAGGAHPFLSGALSLRLRRGCDVSGVWMKMGECARVCVSGPAREPAPTWAPHHVTVS